jgi:hypothetical protein
METAHPNLNMTVSAQNTDAAKLRFANMSQLTRQGFTL